MEFGRREDLDWRQILDLYSGENPPVVPPPRLPISTPRPDQFPALPPIRENHMQGALDSALQLENDGKYLLKF